MEGSCHVSCLSCHLLEHSSTCNAHGWGLEVGLVVSLFAEKICLSLMFSGPSVWCPEC